MILFVYSETVKEMSVSRAKAFVIVLIPVIVAGLYLSLILRYSIDQNDGYIGALLDDTWIHIRFAENIAEGNGLSYNDGVVTTGATSPLWVLLLAAAYTITNPDITQQLHIAIAMSAAGNLLMVLAITGFGWWSTRRAWVGVLAGIITALTGRMIWMGLSGMEATLFSALCVLAMWSHLVDLRAGRVFGWRTGILLALATLARPEGYLLAVLIGLDAFILVPLRRGISVAGLWQHGFSGWRGIVSYVLLAGTYPLVSLMISGYPLPNTFRVKSQLGREYPDLPYAYFWEPRFDHGWLFILLMFVGIGYLLWAAWKKRESFGFVWALWPVFFVLAVLFLGAEHYVLNNSRYVAPAIPFHALAASIGVWVMADFVAHRYRASARNVTIIVLALILSGSALWLGRAEGPQVATDTRQLRTMHVAAGEWFHEATEPDDLIALNDVGAIVHIADRPVLDMIGLVSPEVIAAVDGTERFTCPHDLAIARLMLEKPPRFIGVFPWFYPCLTSWSGVLQPYNVFTITGPTVIAGGEMVIYAPVWANWPVQSRMSDSAVPLDVGYEQGINLQGYEVEIVESGLQVTLWWGVDASPDMDYTIFAHLIDRDGRIISQKDGRPQNNQFNTEWWRAGDIIPDIRLIELDDITVLQQDGLALRIGLYTTDGGVRLPRTAAPIGEEDFAVIPLASFDES